MSSYEVSLSGGYPWGLRVQGGIDFGVPLNISFIFPCSNALDKDINIGDAIIEVNETRVDELKHSEACHLIKTSGEIIFLRLAHGDGRPIGGMRRVSAKGTFGNSTSDALSEPSNLPAIQKVDAGDYARKMKEGLENIRKNSDVLKFIKKNEPSK